jgi:hypothetical protein
MEEMQLHKNLITRTAVTFSRNGTRTYIRRCTQILLQKTRFYRYEKLIGESKPKLRCYAYKNSRSARHFSCSYKFGAFAEVPTLPLLTGNWDT